MEPEKEKHAFQPWILIHLAGSSFHSWGQGRKGEWESSSLLHSSERDLLQRRCQGPRKEGWYYPPSPHPCQAAQKGYFSPLAWVGDMLIISVLIKASTCSLVPLCCGWYQKFRAQGPRGWICLTCTRRGIISSQGPTMAGTLLLVLMAAFCDLENAPLPQGSRLPSVGMLL